MSINDPQTIAELMTKDAIEAEEKIKANVRVVLLLSINCPECKSERPFHLINCHLRWAEDELRLLYER